MKNDDIILLGGIGEKKSNSGTQYYEQDRVYDPNGIATALHTLCQFAPNYQIEGEKEMSNLRIRKLTPCECLKLMGFTRKDFEAMRQIGMSDSQIYHCAGDSLITIIAAGLIGVMCLNEKELRKKQEEYVEVIKNEKKDN